MRIFFSLLVLIFSLSFCSGGKPSNVRAPSIFPPQETDLHKYSAVLAATEPFRNLCQDQIKQVLGPFQSLSCMFSGSKLLEKAEKYRQKNSAIDVAINRFEKRVDHALKSYGMTAQEFNQISQALSPQHSLRRKVLLQSYFYKIAADLDANISRNLPNFPTYYKGRTERIQLPSILKSSSSKPLSSSSPSSPSSSPTSKSLLNRRNSYDVIKFSKALYEIEHERLKLRDKLKRDLHLEDLPPNMSHPTYLPAMCGQIQKACKNFPSAVSEILRRESLTPEVFDDLYSKMNSSTLFKWKIQKNLKNISRERKKALDLERMLRDQKEKLKNHLQK